MTLITRTAIYTRISEDDGTALGVARQERDCRALAARLGWEVEHVFEDNDVSATRAKIRPAYQRMLRAIEGGLVHALIVWDVDRLTRTPRELEDIIDMADRLGLKLASVGGEIDLATPQGRLTARLKGSVARHEVEQQSRRLKRKYQEKAEKGEPHGYAPFGYRRTRGRDEPDGIEAPIVREIADRLLNGESLGAIARDLNERRIVSPGDAAKVKKAERLGLEPPSLTGRWNTTIVRQIALRPTYAGLRVYRGDVVGESTTVAIIERDTHDRLVALLRDPARLPNRAAPLHRYLLSGLLRCGKCGETREGRLRAVAGYTKTSAATGKVLHVGPAYACSTCFGIRRSVAKVDEAVESVVLARMILPDARAVFASSDERAAREARDELAAVEARLAGAADAYSDGSIDAAQLRRITGQLRARRDAAARRLSAAQLESPVATLATADHVEATWTGMDIQQKRTVIDYLLTVTVLPSRPGRTFSVDDIRIDWKDRH